MAHDAAFSLGLSIVAEGPEIPLVEYVQRKLSVYSFKTLLVASSQSKDLAQALDILGSSNPKGCYG